MSNEVEVLEAEVKLRNAETAILQARLDIARAYKRIEALEADMKRSEESVTNLKQHLENLQK